MKFSDYATIAILTVVNVVLATSALAGSPVLPMLGAHLLLEAGFLMLMLWVAGHRCASWIRPVAVVATMFTLYGSLGKVAFAAIPWTADGWLNALERALFLGHSPTLAVEAISTEQVVETLSFFYALFIPFVYLGLFNGLVKRSSAERDHFLDGLALVYAIGFLGYLFLPAKGPIDFLSAAVSAPLEGGFFHGLVVKSIEIAGGPHGAMPSLHIGVSVYLCAMEIHLGRQRGWFGLPFVALLYAATVVLRYHYVIDLLVGTAVALAAVRIIALREQRIFSTVTEPNYILINHENHRSL